LIKNTDPKVKLSDYFGFVEQGVWTKRLSLEKKLSFENQVHKNFNEKNVMTRGSKVSTDGFEYWAKVGLFSNGS